MAACVVGWLSGGLHPELHRPIALAAARLAAIGEGHDGPGRGVERIELGSDGHAKAVHALPLRFFGDI